MSTVAPLFTPEQLQFIEEFVAKQIPPPTPPTPPQSNKLLVFGTLFIMVLVAVGLFLGYHYGYVSSEFSNNSKDVADVKNNLAQAVTDQVKDKFGMKDWKFTEFETSTGGKYICLKNLSEQKIPVCFSVGKNGQDAMQVYPKPANRTSAFSTDYVSVKNNGSVSYCSTADPSCDRSNNFLNVSKYTGLLGDT